MLPRLGSGVFAAFLGAYRHQHTQRLFAILLQLHDAVSAASGRPKPNQRIVVTWRGFSSRAPVSFDLSAVVLPASDACYARSHVASSEVRAANRFPLFPTLAPGGPFGGRV